MRAELVLADLVRHHREQRGWTQAVLAERLEAQGLHLHPSAVTRIEKHDRGIGLDEALALLRALELSPATVLGVLAEIDTEAPPTLIDRLAHARVAANLTHELVDRALQEALNVIDPP
jgi:transcriptional regulator with XRE-family HTH domain